MRKFLFVSTMLYNHFFFILLKSCVIIFYKIYKIFEKFDGVSRTLSVSSLKFFLKPASQYEKLQNISQVFHPRRETIDLWFLSMGSCRTNYLFSTCLWTIAELCLLTQVRDFVYKCVLSLRSTKPVGFIISN